MPWISLDERAGPPGPHGGEQPSAQSIRCDLCSWEAATRRGSLRRQDAQCPGVCGGFLLVPPCGRRCVLTYGHRGGHLCRECIGFLRVNEACHCTSSPKAPPPGTSSQAHPDHVPPKAPPPGTSSQAHPGRVPPKAPPPGTSSQEHLEERLAALEEEMIRLRLRVAELEQHSSGAATG